MRTSLYQIVLVTCLSWAWWSTQAQSGSSLVGTWQYSQAGEVQTLILNGDGTGSLNSENLQYQIQGNLLAVTTSSGTVVYTFGLQGNKLSVTGGDIEGLMVFVKLEQSSRAPAQQPSFSSTSKDLLGTWSGEGEVIEFRSSGICRYNEILIPYRISQGHVILQASTGDISFAYTVKAGRLVLAANGQQAVYQKISEVAPSSPVTKKERNPADLVGQWCYLKSSTGTFSGRCITLNADGTYRYTEERSMSVQTEEISGGTASQGSDSGTWYVQGDRLYYQSTTRGSGSYRLERRNHPKNVNDPMIVLDDEPFVTTTQRPPWR
ncbi:MAG: hypothetical protein JNL40_13730 [Cyclobacteriaceae bacterium]|nr:hypothetical protein [Cyclobacteriaceae bacterium]